MPVEVAYGPEGAVVEHGDGRRVTIGVDEVAVFATVEHNPGDHRDVTRVRVTLPADLLASGAVLVDTPGLGRPMRIAPRRRSGRCASPATALTRPLKVT